MRSYLDRAWLVQGSVLELMLTLAVHLAESRLLWVCRYIERSEIVISQRSDGRLWELGAGSTAKVCHQHSRC